MDTSRLVTFIPFLASLIRAVLISWGSVEFQRAEEASAQIAPAIAAIAGIAWGQYEARKRIKQQSQQKTESKHENSN